MNDALANLIAQRVRIVGQPLRLRLITHLREKVEAATVQELTHALGAVQQNVSQHLAILHQAGILARSKEGTQVYYTLVDPQAIVIIEAATASLAKHSNELARLTAEQAE